MQIPMIFACAQVLGQTTQGLDQLRRTANFLKKSTDLMEKSKVAEAVSKLVDVEEKFHDKPDVEDGMTQHYEALKAVPSFVAQFPEVYMGFMSRVQQRVTQPLLQFLQEAEATKKEIITKERKAAQGLKSLEDSLEKDRSACLKMLPEITAANKNVEEEVKVQPVTRSVFSALCLKYLSLSDFL